MGSNITMIVTSCNRHDLLKQTLDSFIAMSDVKPDATIIIEDSATPMPEWLKDDIHTYSSRLGKVQWIQNETRMGQLCSIDRAYAEVKSDYIFHCEDDWQFCQRNFMGESKEILDKYPAIFQVSLRGDTDWHPLVSDKDFSFKIAEPGWRGGWGGISFNPGLRRLSDYKKIGSYGRYVSYGTSGLEHEMLLSKLHLSFGYLIADLGRPIVSHLGGGRSKAVEPLPPLPKVLIAVPTCFAFDYESKWENSGNAQYGKDMHVSGPNDQTQAVRETWAKDIEPFKDRVELKFFYGKPKDGYPRQPLADEVFLDCPDGYGSLPQKTIGVCQYAAEHDYDFVYKCDTDTAVYVDRLIRELLTQRFDYAGYNHCNVCSGGPGYWLSKKAFTLVSQNKPTHWAEDVETSKILGCNNIQPVMLAGHRPGFSAHFFFPGGFDPATLSGDLVTMHALFPKEMRDWWQFTKDGLWPK